VRGHAKERATGQRRDIWKVLPDATAAKAMAYLEAEKERIRVGGRSVELPNPRFSEFVTSLFDRKVATRDIKAASGRKKWARVLEHLIAGTTGPTSGGYVAGLGDYYVAEIRGAHLERWKSDLAQLMAAGDYAPTTINGWFAILRVVMKAAKYELELPHLATEGLRDFDTSEHETYSEEEPNSLLPEEVGPYLERFRVLHPKHFAMLFLGLVTGLRPSSLRPLRRQGPEPDVLWTMDRVLVRRSQTYGDEVMQTTKQRRRYGIDLPPEAMAILKWHVETQLTTPEQRASDLLFPSVNGKFRSPSVLNKPMAEVAEDLQLGKRFTQRGLRRTFNDLARAARVDDLVTRSISGHLTERMQHHYSTVNAAEQREALAQVIRLAVPPRDDVSRGEHEGEQAVPGGEHQEKAG
jgi:integrase